jgi:signal transduction histidine kinase
MIVTSALVTLVAGLLGGGLVWILRGRSILVTMTLTVLTAVGAMVVGVVIAANQMFISDHDLGVTIAIVITAAVVGTATTLAFGRRVAMTFKQHEAEAADRERERAVEAGRRELVAWMSHDLRSPLAAIRAMAEALEDGVVDDPDTVMTYYRSIGLESQKLSEMVDDLFTLARLQDGRVALNKQRVTAADLVAQATSSAAPLADARHVVLQGQAPEIPLCVDVKEVARLLGNLLSNAIRHSPEGGRVTISGHSDGDGVVLTVQDQCGGIPEEDLPRLFEVAFRGTSARTPTADGGAGLGLAIARGIADAHGGAIDVRNVEGGCCFTARFPADTATVEVNQPVLQR